MGPTTTCPHCGAESAAGAYCTICGQALPALAPSGPRVLGSNDLANTQAGRSLQAEELKKQSRKAAGALLAVAILQVVFGAIVLAGMPIDVPPQTKTIVAVTVFGIGAIFFALYFWARVQPFPAAIVGLIFFITVHLLDAIADPQQIIRGIIVKIIIIAILAQAIKAGAQYRRLQRETT